MVAPNPAVQIGGLGSVSADNLNTFVQVCLSYQQMRGFTGLSNMVVYALGTTTPGDGGSGFFYWNPTSTAPDNNSTIIVPSGAVQGAWILTPNQHASYLTDDVPLGSAIPLATGVPSDVAFVVLQPGTWLVSGNFQLNPAGSTTLADVSGWISTSSATIPLNPEQNGTVSLSTSGEPNFEWGLPVGQVIVTVSIPTPVYLTALVTFGVSSVSVYGQIQAIPL